METSSPMPLPEAPPTKKLELGRFWTLANMLSLSRAFIVIPIVYLILNNGSLTYLAFFIVIGVATDWLDGQVARWTNTVSEWGKLLDPLADKIAAIGIVAALVIQGRFPIWLLSIIAGRDLLIMIGSAFLAKRMGNVSMSIWTGKVAVTVLSITILACVLNGDAQILQMWIETTAFLFIYSFALYIMRTTIYLRNGKDGKLGQVLDAFANEITVTFGVWRFWVHQIPMWEAWFWWIWAAWTLIGIILGWAFLMRNNLVRYSLLMHLPVLFATLLMLFAFLLPDDILVYYGQRVVLGCIALAAFFYIPSTFGRTLIPIHRKKKKSTNG
jgi:CDP-diacylglycerol--glycerol-3-phosphate 3-phosphatidyltransferase